MSARVYTLATAPRCEIRGWCVLGPTDNGGDAHEHGCSRDAICQAGTCRAPAVAMMECDSYPGYHLLCAECLAYEVEHWVGPVEGAMT